MYPCIPISAHTYKFSIKLNIICLRPATVCGASDRIRLDLTINKLAYDAMTKGKIFVDGGSQIRPNVYIQDIIDVIFFFIKKKKLNTTFIM